MKKETFLLVLVPIRECSSEEKEGIRSRTGTQKYADNWDRIFGSKEKETSKSLN